MTNDETIRQLAEDARRLMDGRPSITDFTVFVDARPSDTHHLRVEDKDVSRLEGRIEASNRESQLRIEAVNREGQLRLDAAMARIDGKFEAITQAVADIKVAQSESRDSMRSWGTWIIATVLAVGLGMAGLVVGVRQVWIGGVQVGQTISTSVVPKP